MKVPDEPKAIGAYVGELLQVPLAGMTSDELKGKDSQIADLKGGNAKLAAEVSDLKEQLAAMKKAK